MLDRLPISIVDYIMEFHNPYREYYRNHVLSIGNGYGHPTNIWKAAWIRKILSSEVNMEELKFNIDHPDFRLHKEMVLLFLLKKWNILPSRQWEKPTKRWYVLDTAIEPGRYLWHDIDIHYSHEYVDVCSMATEYFPTDIVFNYHKDASCNSALIYAYIFVKTSRFISSVLLFSGCVIHEDVYESEWNMIRNSKNYIPVIRDIVNKITLYDHVVPTHGWGHRERCSLS